MRAERNANGLYGVSRTAQSDTKLQTILIRRLHNSRVSVEPRIFIARAAIEIVI